jgi:hypothetical protein
MGLPWLHTAPASACLLQTAQERTSLQQWHSFTQHRLVPYISSTATQGLSTLWFDAPGRQYTMEGYFRTCRYASCQGWWILMIATVLLSWCRAA